MEDIINYELCLSLGERVYHWSVIEHKWWAGDDALTHIPIYYGTEKTLDEAYQSAKLALAKIEKD